MSTSITISPLYLDAIIQQTTLEPVPQARPNHPIEALTGSSARETSKEEVEVAMWALYLVARRPLPRRHRPASLGSSREKSLPREARSPLAAYSPSLIAPNLQP